MVILGFGGCFFLLKFWWKIYWKMDFSSFWQYLAFGGCFYLIGILIKKQLKNGFFQLLAISWFWWLLELIEILKEKKLKNWFFKLGNMLWRLLFLIEILKKLFENLIFAAFGNTWFWWMLEKLTAMQDRLSQTCLKKLTAMHGIGSPRDAWKAHGHAG